MFIQASQGRSQDSCAQNKSTENLTLSCIFARFSDLLVRGIDQLVDAREQSRTQAQLEALSDRALDDIGLSRADVDVMRVKRR
jgi:uncharacterized protein YjiS (DUF1127 family)